jgi:hypothetical protein
VPGTFTRADALAIVAEARRVVGERREDDWAGRKILHDANGLETRVRVWPHVMQSDDAIRFWRDIVNDAIVLKLEASDYARRTEEHRCPCCGQALPGY